MSALDLRRQDSEQGVAGRHRIGTAVQYFWADRLTMLPRSAYEISRRLAQEGYGVTIVTERDGSQGGGGTATMSGGVEVQYRDGLSLAMDGDGFNLVSFYGGLLRALTLTAGRRPAGPLVLHLYTAKVPLRDLSGLRPSDLAYDRRVLLGLNALLTDLVPGPAIARVLGRCHRVIVQSHGMERFYSRLLGAERVARVPHGVDFHRFAHYDPEEAQRLKRGLGLAPEQKVVLYLGHAFLVRGIDDVIHAMEAVRREVPQAAALLVLNRMPRSPMGRIEALAAASGLGDSVKTVVGYVARPELYLGLADVVVLPYRFRPELPEYPLVLLEAMAAGRPVVTTGIGAIPEVVRDGHNGILVSPRDRDGLAQAIVGLLADDERASALGRSAQETAAEFDWGTAAARVADIYREVLCG